ncbi:hypothetical protein TgHK011_007085 [Trichoderma gracile]|nr:hypothetical protein TgHK011_007085 [Trichoderma gracile]
MVGDGRVLRLDEAERWLITVIDSKPSFSKIFFGELPGYLGYAVRNGRSHSSSTSAHEQSSLVPQGVAWAWKKLKLHPGERGKCVHRRLLTQSVGGLMELAVQYEEPWIVSNGLVEVADDGVGNNIVDRDVGR